MTRGDGNGHSNAAAEKREAPTATCPCSRAPDMDMWWGRAWDELGKSNEDLWKTRFVYPSAVASGTGPSDARLSQSACQVSSRRHACMRVCAFAWRACMHGLWLRACSHAIDGTKTAVPNSGSGNAALIALGSR